MPKLKVGVIGCGWNGRRHAELYDSMEEAELVGVCDIIPEAANRVAQKHGVKAFNRVEDLTKEPGLEAVSVVSSTHCEPTIIAAEAGKHILVEVPFAATLEECDRMIAASEKSGVNLMYAQSDRYKPANIAAKTLIDSGEIGDIISMIHIQLSNGAPPSTQNEPPKKSDWAGSPESKRWNLWKKSGGGILTYVVPHHTDIYRWFANSDFDIVYSVGMGRYASDGDGEDNDIGGFRFKNGVFAAMLDGKSNPGAFIDEWRIVGTKGMIEIKVPQNRMIGAELNLGKGTWESIEYPNKENQPIEGFDMIASVQGYNSWTSELREFINSIQEKRQPAITGYDGRAALEVGLALRKSEETGNIIRLPLT